MAKQAQAAWGKAPEERATDAGFWKWKGTKAQFSALPPTPLPNPQLTILLQGYLSESE